MWREAKCALVTGGAKRIGRAISLDLAAHGFHVAIHSNRSHEEARELVSSIRAGGGHACVVDADLTSPDQAEKLVDEAAKQLGPIGLVVNNASVFERDSLLDFSEEIWERHFSLHVKAPALIARRFAKALPSDMQGLIVNMIDQRVWKPTPEFFSYTLSKAALWTATTTMAQTLAPRIRVNAIGPGPTLPDKYQGEEGFYAETRALPLGRGPELPEFGATIRYLWETPSITGQMIALDGGKHLAWEKQETAGSTK